MNKSTLLEKTNFDINFSDEQKDFIVRVAKSADPSEDNREKNNFIVDACIGSGKTTSIIAVANVLVGNYNKSVLYLTYNKLLKEDARTRFSHLDPTKIHIHNYHSFIIKYLSRAGIDASNDLAIREFLRLKPQIDQYDTIIIDEYQDLTKLRASLLTYIVNHQRVKPQLIFVGDMDQKISQDYSLDVKTYIEDLAYPCQHLTFTNCFRIDSNYANQIGKFWNKTINGCNKNHIIKHMTVDDTVEFLIENVKSGKYNISDILCLSPTRKTKSAINILNAIEHMEPTIFNKDTVYASIFEYDRPDLDTKNAAIFTTFDSSKGLDRRISIVCDFDRDNWIKRSKPDGVNYTILKNIFLVGATRGKDITIFVHKDTIQTLLDLDDLLIPFTCSHQYKKPIKISNMYSFKNESDIFDCYDLIDINPISNITFELTTKIHQGYMNISSCINNWMKVSYFNNYDIDNIVYKELLVDCTYVESGEIYLDEEELNRKFNDYLHNYTNLEEKIAYYTYLETKQERYIKEMDYPYINSIDKTLIHNRLISNDIKSNEIGPIKHEIRINCNIDGEDKLLDIVGYSDFIKDSCIYQLAFKSTLGIEDYLKLATCIICSKYNNGILYNVKTNEKFSIMINDKEQYIASMIKCITKSNIVIIYNWEVLD